jgi:hypothetical protein
MLCSSILGKLYARIGSRVEEGKLRPVGRIQIVKKCSASRDVADVSLIIRPVIDF